MKLTPLLIAVAIELTLLSGCGGGSSPAAVAPVPPVAPPDVPQVTPPVTPPVIPPVVTPPVTPPIAPPVIDPANPPDWYALLGRCEHPNAENGDTQGTLMDELRWLRSFSDATYLWYREIPSNLNLQSYSSAVSLFADLKTPAITASGRLKDRFHFTYPTDAWNARSSAGVALGYGMTWVRNTDPAAPPVWTLTMVAPDSPAGLAGLRRGDSLVSVDGVAVGDSSDSGHAAVYAGLFPVKAGESHQLVMSRAGADADLAVTLTAKQVTQPPVQNAKVLDTASGKVGYLQFNDHNEVAEGQLVKSINTFKAAGIADLVLDMRYNGGGLLSIASELAYMIAGPGPTTGKVFERPQYNDKTVPQRAQMFQSYASGYKSPEPVQFGASLPYLGLKRVTVLTTPGTCSASESVINSLRGVDLEVDLIGDETCGKPYAFTPASNCGTTYFTIQFQGTNDKGFGDYTDGFTPTCRAGDDLTRAQGDPAESLLATALSYRANGVCPATPLRNRTLAGAMKLVRPQVKEISIRDR